MVTEFRTYVTIDKSCFQIEPNHKILMVGSCFAQNIGNKLIESRFNTLVNPYGVMYNPASILHTVERSSASPQIGVFTLGTNHVYILKETEEIVDNCEKRPQKLFREEELSIEQCTNYLENAINLLKARNPEVKIILTVSPIRYAKYGYHESSLSKSILLLAAKNICMHHPNTVSYFPAYEIMNDELRDYRYYAEDMLHPNAVAINYIWQRFQETYFSKAANSFTKEWEPLQKALKHKPFNPHGAEYKQFISDTLKKVRAFENKWQIAKLDGMASAEFKLIKAKKEDAPEIYRLIDAARKQMIAKGRKQWSEKYPAFENIENDILSGNAYIGCENGKMVAYAVVSLDGEPAYKELKGKWLSNSHYLVVHRMAVSVSERGRGIGRKYLQAVERKAISENVHSIKIDTNYDNKEMLSLLSSLDYSCCGQIDYKTNGRRIAFEKLLAP